MTWKRHSPADAAAKLRQADELLQQGKKQREIANILGISAMTYHRWRRAHAGDSGAAADPSTRKPEVGFTGEQRNGNRDFVWENTQLRKLVIDLLLEKLNLQDALNGPKAGRRTKHSP
jgi:putative transposase